MTTWPSYIQGFRDGLEAAARLVESNRPNHGSRGPIKELHPNSPVEIDVNQAAYAARIRAIKHPDELAEGRE